MSEARELIVAVGKKRACRTPESSRCLSVLGPLHLERAYYHCSPRGHGFSPRDRQLGIENTSLSPALTRMIGTVGPRSASRRVGRCPN